MLNIIPRCQIITKSFMKPPYLLVPTIKDLLIIDKPMMCNISSSAFMDDVKK